MALPNGDLSEAKVPIVILAGSDRKAAAVPRGAEGFHFVAGGYKGADIQIAGRPLIQVVVERIRASSAFGEIYVAGPASVYKGLVDCPIIDTDSTVGQNILRAEHHVRRCHGDSTRVAFMACDILPTAEEISDLAARLMEPLGPTSVSSVLEPSIPVVSISLCSLGDVEAGGETQRLGASVWKPRYNIRLEPNSPPVPFLPGHLAVVWPARMRTGIFSRLLRLAYQERNRDFEARRRSIVWHLLGALIWRDILNLFRLHPPALTFAVLHHGLRAFVRWRRGELDIYQLAKAIEAVAVRQAYARRAKSCTVRIVVTEHLSFAKDLDTREEIAEVSGKECEQ